MQIARHGKVVTECEAVRAAPRVECIECNGEASHGHGRTNIIEAILRSER